MRKLFVLVCVGVALSAVAGRRAQAVNVLLDFDALAPGTVLDNEYAGLGVVFSASTGVLDVLAEYPGPNFTSPNVVLPSDYGNAANCSQATFSVPVTGVSVSIGDYNADVDDIYLQLFDAAWGLIGSDSDTLPGSLFGAYTLAATTSGPNVAYATWWGDGLGNNSVYWDNFGFTTGVIPEPATIALLGIGLAGVALKRRKK